MIVFFEIFWVIWFAIIFSIFKIKNPIDYEMDELDELDFEDSDISKKMDKLFDMTKNNELFKTLYELAAAKIISTDQKLGQCILFSYDYLYLYHPCLCVFLCSPEEFTESCPYYMDLKKLLEQR